MNPDLNDWRTGQQITVEVGWEKVVGRLERLSLHQDVMPIYTFGNDKPVSTVKGRVKVEMDLTVRDPGFPLCGQDARIYADGHSIRGYVTASSISMADLRDAMITIQGEMMPQYVGKTHTAIVIDEYGSVPQVRISDYLPEVAALPCDDPDERVLIDSVVGAMLCTAGLVEAPEGAKERMTSGADKPDAFDVQEDTVAPRAGFTDSISTTRGKRRWSEWLRDIHV